LVDLHTKFALNCIYRVVYQFPILCQLSVFTLLI